MSAGKGNEALIRELNLIGVENLIPKLFMLLRDKEIFYFEKANGQGAWCRKMNRPFQQGSAAPNAINLKTGEKYYFRDSQPVHVLAGKF